jgi:hypothetical protein
MQEHYTNPKYGKGFPANGVTMARRIVKSGKVQLPANTYGYNPRVSERSSIRNQALRTLSK